MGNLTSMVDVIWSPIATFQALMRREPRWLRAAVPVVIQAGLIAVGVVILTYRAQGIIMDAMTRAAVPIPFFPPAVLLGGFSAIFGFAFMFWAPVGGILALDAMFAGSGRSRWLLECTAVSYWSQIPWGIANILILVLWFNPEPLVLPSGTQDMLTSIESYRADLEASPAMLTSNLVGAYFGLWLVALQACALHVVSGFTVRGSWAAGIVLGSVFVVIPWAVQRF